MATRVLVTGAAGFIGSHVCERLIARGDEVVGIDNFDPFYDPSIKRGNLEGLLRQAGFTLIEADIRESDELERRLRGTPPEAIVHLAAKAGVRPSLESPIEYLRVNVEGTGAMLELARRLGVRAFVFGSSSSVYGNSSRTPFVETDPAAHPISPYAASKRAAELLCQTYAGLYGLGIAALRFFTVYGPRQRPDLAIHRFARALIEEREITLFGDGSTRRDYTYVDDIVNGVLAATDFARRNGGMFELFNLAGGSSVPLRAVVSQLSEILGVEARIRHIGEQPGDVSLTHASIEKARTLLGYRPEIPFEEGLRRFVAWLEPASVAG